MTIGIDCRLYSPRYTGIGRYVYELIQQLIKLDQKNHYILFFNKKEFDEFEVPNERWEKRLANVPHYSWTEQTTFYFLLKKEDLDLMYFPHFNTPIRYKKPFIVTIHDLTLHYYPYKEYHPKWSLKKQFHIWVYRLLMGQVVKHARQIIAVSKNTKRDLIKEYQVSEDKIDVVLEGVPEDFQNADEAGIEAVKKKYAIDKPYLLYTGVWRSHKNLLKLITSFHQLMQEGRELQLVLTGKKDPAYPEIPALITKLGLEQQVILTGFVSDEDLIRLNSGASIFVFPSLYEGFGLPPLEAMQFGVPVACSKAASLPEVCGDAAEYFDPQDVGDISRAIRQLLDDKNCREELIQKGFENLRLFSWKDMTGQFLDIVNNKCNNSSQTKKHPADLP